MSHQSYYDGKKHYLLLLFVLTKTVNICRKRIFFFGVHPFWEEAQVAFSPSAKMMKIFFLEREASMTHEGELLLLMGS
jgi:hypothetical protein